MAKLGEKEEHIQQLQETVWQPESTIASLRAEVGRAHSNARLESERIAQLQEKVSLSVPNVILSLMHFLFRMYRLAATIANPKRWRVSGPNSD